MNILCWSKEEENEVNAAAIQERRVARELKLLASKLRSYKEKQAIALKERHSLREQLRKQQKILRQEKKKYKALQKEVDKMAKLMKDDEVEEEEEEKPEDEDEEEEVMFRSRLISFNIYTPEGACELLQWGFTVVIGLQA